MGSSEVRESGGSARAAARRAVDLLVVLLGEEPPSVESVGAVLREHGEREPLGLDRAHLLGLREAAGSLREVFAAETTAQAAGALNDLLARHAHPPRLTTHGGEYPWHVHVDAHDDAPWHEWFLASSCHALATLLVDHARPPGGLCAAHGCGRPFLDLGGGSRRRYCSTRCATRERVAAHRRRPRPS